MSLNFPEMRAAFHTGSTVSVGVANTVLLAADARRIALTWGTNPGTEPIYINAPSPAVVGEGFVMNNLSNINQQFYFADFGPLCTRSWAAITTVGAKNLRVHEVSRGAV